MASAIPKLTPGLSRGILPPHRETPVSTGNRCLSHSKKLGWREYGVRRSPESGVRGCERRLRPPGRTLRSCGVEADWAATKNHETGRMTMAS